MQCMCLHIVTWLSDDRRVLDWWLDLLSPYTTCDYTLHITIAHRLVFSVTLLGNGFYQWMFLSFRTHELSLIFSCQLPTSAVNSWLASGLTQSKQASSSLLLAFASMVILGVEPHRDPWPWPTGSPYIMLAQTTQKTPSSTFPPYA
jgi:hypothetical protein